MASRSGPRSPFHGDARLETCTDAIVTFTVATALLLIARGAQSEKHYQTALARSQKRVAKLAADYIEQLTVECERSLKVHG